MNQMGSIAPERNGKTDAVLALRGLNVSYPVYGARPVRAVRNLDL